MTELSQLRHRYATTPRRMDDELRRRARGDRSCFADSVAGIGALLALVAAAAAAAGWVPTSAIFGGVVLLVVGFALGMVGQLRSGKVRRRAIESGPLVVGWAVGYDPELVGRQSRVRWARVVFSLDPARRFDTAYLKRVAADVSSRSRSPTQPSTPAGQVLANLPMAHAQTLQELPAGGQVEQDTWIADVMVYPDRLADRRLNEKAPVVGLIADVGGRVVEHI
ncbi:MAG: hypothetical protein B7733_00325 [Myxococcales bacterium FL481]|nr:MAG: hypothetical protein B7733_00325 [Myxococcales bacterium FL481]